MLTPGNREVQRLRGRGIIQRSVVHTFVVSLVVRHTYFHGSGASPSVAIVRGETNVIDTAVSRNFGGAISLRPHRRRIGTDSLTVGQRIAGPLTFVFHWFVLTNRIDRNRNRITIGVGDSCDVDWNEFVVRRPQSGEAGRCIAAIRRARMGNKHVV